MKKLIMLALLCIATVSHAQDELYVGGGKFNADAGNCAKIIYSHYVGWEPYAYLATSEVLGKHAKEQGVCVEVELIPDYITSLEAFTNGTAQGVTATNMDLLSFQSSTGKTEVIIAGDYSNGNDAILIRSPNKVDMQAVKGKQVGIVELSVNDYLLDRCATKAGLTRSDFKVINFTSEGDIAAQFASQKGNGFVATVWNPVLMNLRSSVNDAQVVCDSSQIPGEIVDVLAVDAKLSDKHKQAIVNAWYDTMAAMTNKGKLGKDARSKMALNAENSLAEYEQQLKTTAMWYTPESAVSFIEGAQMSDTTKSVYGFARKAGIVASKQSISINDKLVVDEAGTKASINYTSKYTRNAINR